MLKRETYCSHPAATVCSKCGQPWAYGRPIPPFAHVDCANCPVPTQPVAHECRPNHRTQTEADECPSVATQPVAECGYCYSCGILGAPRFYYDASQCRELGHDVRPTRGEVSK